MHELKREFEILMARMDDLLALLEAGSGISAEILVPRLREQAAKTGAVLDEAIQDFSLLEDVADEFMPVDPEFPDEEEDESSETEEVAIGEADSDEDEDEEEETDDDEGDSNDNS